MKSKHFVWGNEEKPLHTWTPENMKSKHFVAGNEEKHRHILTPENDKSKQFVEGKQILVAIAVASLFLC